MEMLQGNTLCSYDKQTKVSFFFIYKIEEQEAKKVLLWGRGWYQCEKGRR
jgi:hypothetical protein